MIEILMDGMCNGCEHADLELNYLEYLDGRKTWTVKCVHRNACDNMETKTIKRIKKGELEDAATRI